MALSLYHQKYADQSEEEIQKRVDVKEQELVAIFHGANLKTDSNPVRLAVLGCGDKRFVAHHKRIFENVLQRNVEVTTFDIITDHLIGELNIIQHDCMLPLPNPPYDITYSHVLLRFIETEKQFEILRNSYDALKPGGVAIHVMDKEDYEAEGSHLKDGLLVVPHERWKNKLTELGIEYREIAVQYGLALVLIRR